MPLPPTSMPIPATPKPTFPATRPATEAPSIPKATPVPDQHPPSSFTLPDRVSHDAIKQEGNRLAAQAEGDNKPRYPR